MKILAGRYKGRNLLSPVGRQVTRPITSLARKSLMDTLGDSLDGAVVLDLFSGTGTLGLESLSRGARLCCFAERDAVALRRLRRNIETIGATDDALVWRGDIYRTLRRRLERLDAKVDLAFVDPPYAQSRQWSADIAAWRDIQRRIFNPLSDNLADGGIVILRMQASVELPEKPATLAVRRVKRYGDMVVTLMESRME